MSRLLLISGLYSVVLIVVCCSDLIPELTNKTVQSKKRTEKCLQYHANVFGNETPSCPAESEFPYLAIIGYRSFASDDLRYGWDCYGTLVSSQYVMTTGHCLQNPRGAAEKVRLGAANSDRSGKPKGTDYDIAQIIVHHNHEGPSAYNDIALIKLSRKVGFTQNVRPICLPEHDIDPSSIYYMVHSRSKMPFTKYIVDYVTNDMCTEAHRSNGRISDGITNNLVCIKYDDANNCHVSFVERHGIPLFVDHSQLACAHVQVGVLIFGSNCGSSTPEVSANVYRKIYWIEKTIWANTDDF